MTRPFLPLRYALPFLFLALLSLAARSGVEIWLFLPLLIAAFVGFDALLGIAADGGEPAAALLHRLLPRLYIPCQLATTLWGVVTAAHLATPSHLLGLALAVGAAAGIFGMLAAHEMIHARHPAERALGLAMLASVGYMHFRISHLHGHHRHAATRADPATARAGESVYRFLGRSVAGQWHGAWRFERRRIAGRHPLANRLVWYLAIEAALILAAALALGERALIFLAVQAVIAIAILEIFNYIAHYGLRRGLLPGRGREPLGPQHSWNAGQRFNNWALFNGGHHSDHHRAPGRAYFRLRATPEAPQLPFGYGGTILLALVPPLWRRIMAPRLAAANARRPARPPRPPTAAPLRSAGRAA
jgi:alkane 1-monooxygenase